MGIVLIFFLPYRNTDGSHVISTLPRLSGENILPKYIIYVTIKMNYLISYFMRKLKSCSKMLKTLISNFVYIFININVFIKIWKM